MWAAPLLAEEGGGIGALGVDLGSLIAYLVNFGVLLVLLYFFAYKRILGMLDQRSSRIKESLEEADRVRQGALEQQASMQRTLDEGRQEGQRVLADAREMAERYRQEETERAKRDAESLLERARAEIQQERATAVEEVRQEFAALAMTAAERIIHRSVDAAIHQEIIAEVLQDSETLRGQGG
jgi:F-type H+-transporting ATPase subunit b